MSMFCYQCQETARGTGCEIMGVCGKKEEVAKLQDLLMDSLKQISQIVIRNQLHATNLTELNREVTNSLFMTITNANFDEDAIEKKIMKLYTLRDELESGQENKASYIITKEYLGREVMLQKAELIGVLSTKDEDVRSLRELVVYGLKGMAAYTEHAYNIGLEDMELYQFFYEALNAVTDDMKTLEDLIALTLKTGEFGVKAMALLDQANTQKYGNPELTKVNIGVKANPAILISGHDLVDLEQLLEQTKNTGVDVYTHGEMLPANSYPFFKKYNNLVGNYGNAWWKQLTEFESFHGPILFTTNCIVPPKTDELRNRIFTTGAAGYPGSIHIEADENGKKDFSKIIEMAKQLKSPDEIETGFIYGGFAHHQVIALQDTVVEAVKKGDIKRFFVMGGCDGRMKSRDYYTEFAKKLPKDTIILTAGCAKFRYNKLQLHDIGGIPRVLDAGQCNDSYSLVLIALKLKEAFGLADINDLPISFNIAWYEQKAVIVLLALLSLGVKNIHAGPTLPAFFSPNVLKVLIEKFQLATISTVEEDLELFLG